MQNNLRKQEQTAIEAVARRFSATWGNGSDASAAYLTVSGKRVAIDVATLKRRNSGQGSAAKPGLRFDKVVVRLMDRLQTTVGKTVPYRMAVLLTMTAPIRLPLKTAAALEDKIQTLLGRGSAVRDEKGTIYGNRIQIRLLRDQSELAPKMLGFVHNPDSDPQLLLNMTGDLLEVLRAKSGGRTATSTAERWLVVINAGATSFLDAYRYICAQLRSGADFRKVLMVFGDGQVEELLG